MLLTDVRAVTRKKLATVALAGLLGAGALTAAGEAAQAQSQEGEVVNREVQVNEDRDYTGLWGLLGLLGLAGLAGLRRKKDDNVDVRRAPSTSENGNVRRGNVQDSEVVRSTEGRNDANGDRVNVDRDVANGTETRRTPGR